MELTVNDAIKITLTKADEGYDLAASKLFGAPTVPSGWEDRFSDDCIFFGQIRLADIAALDVHNRLPHTGYLYLFLDTEVYPYTAWVEYADGEPTTVIDDFNALEPRFAHLTQAYTMTFAAADGDCDGTRLFGVPSSAPDEAGELLLQFDPLDESTGFLEEIDGYAYFFFGDGAARIEGARFVIDRS